VSVQEGQPNETDQHKEDARQCIAPELALPFSWSDLALHEVLTQSHTHNSAASRMVFAIGDL
jgi:hypothetical protein